MRILLGVSVLYGVDVSDTELKEHESQGLTEEIEVQPGETLEAGQDFPAGVYDLVIRERIPKIFCLRVLW